MAQLSAALLSEIDLPAIDRRGDAMTKILKGEESAYISLKLQHNPDFQFIECNVEITYQGVKRRFSGMHIGAVTATRVPAGSA